MRLLLLPKWDQQVAKRITQSETCAGMLSASSHVMRVAICEDCRHHNRDLTEADYFGDQCRHLERGTLVIAQRVSLLASSQ